MEKIVCESCGTDENLRFDPDPFAEEIYGNDTPIWECEDCRYESAMDI